MPGSSFVGILPLLINPSHHHHHHHHPSSSSTATTLFHFPTPLRNRQIKTLAVSLPQSLVLSISSSCAEAVTIWNLASNSQLQESNEHLSYEYVFRLEKNPNKHPLKFWAVLAAIISELGCDETQIRDKYVFHYESVMERNY